MHPVGRLVNLRSLQEFDRPNSAYMLFYEQAESLEPVAPSAASQPSAVPSPTPSHPSMHPDSETAPGSQQAAANEFQQVPAEADTDEPMLPASPQAMQSPPASVDTSPNVLAQLANVSPLKVRQCQLYC